MMTKKVPSSYINKLHILFSILMLTACTAEDPQSYLKQGQELIEQNDLETARVQFQNALQLDPKLADAYFGLALIAEKQQNWAVMHRHLLDTVATDPKHLDGQVKLGQIFLLSELYEKTLEQVKTILQLNPQNKTAKLLQASVDLRQHRYKDAIQQIEDVLIQQPYYADAIALKVGYLMDQKRKQEAGTILEQGIVHNPTDRDLLLLKIRLDTGNKDYDQAAMGYQKLNDLYLEQIWISQTRIDFLISIGQLKQAETVLADLIEKKPEQTELKIKLIDLIERSGTKKQVENKLIEFIAAFPLESRFKFRLSDYYIANTQFTKAKNILQQILSADEKGMDGVNARTKLAQIALLQKDKATMEQWITEILEIDPNHTDALIFRAGIHLKNNQLDAAVNDLRVALANRPDSEQALLLLAQANNLKGEKEVAESQWRKVLEINPNNMAAIVPLTQVLFIRGQYEQSEKLVDKGIENNANSISLIELKIQLAAVKKDWVKAKEAIDKLAQIADTEAAVYYWQGFVAAKQGDAVKAIKKYQQVLNLQPNNSQALNSLAKLYKETGQNKQFIGYLKDKVKQNSEIGLLSITLAIAYLTDGNWQQAEEILLNTVQQGKADTKTYLLLGRIYQQQNKPLQIERLYLTALEKLADNVLIMNELAKHYAINREYAKSIQQYEKIIKKSPENDEVVNNLADLLITHRGDDEKSVQQAEALVERFKNSNHPIIQDTYGWVQLKAGNVMHALMALKKAAASRPEDARILYHLAEAYQQMGDSKSAQLELEKSLAIVAKTNNDFMEIEQAKALSRRLNKENAKK